MDQVGTISIFISGAIGLYWIVKGETAFRFHSGFAVFLFFVLVVEIVGYQMVQLKMYNVWLYNIATSVQITFYAVIFLMSFEVPSHKTTAKILITLYLLFYLTNVFFIQSFYSEFHTYSFMLGSIIIVVLCILYLLELILLEKHLQIGIVSQPLFWIACGLLFFYSGEFIYMSFINLLNGVDVHLSEKFFDIVIILNFIMYTLFAIGFSCHKLFRTSPLS